MTRRDVSNREQGEATLIQGIILDAWLLPAVVPWRAVVWRGVACRGVAWRGVVVEHADSQHRGCQPDFFICQNKNAIGKEGNMKPPREFPTSLEKTQSPISGFCYARNRVCNAVLVCTGGAFLY